MGKSNKKANRKATRGQGKIWKKGQSSVFNPEFNKHRQAAKKRAYFGNQGSSNLTVAQLEQHNVMTVDNQSVNDEVMSIGAPTGLTGFTNCSLPTFNRLLKNWNSNSFLHVKMRAALEAVADVIKSTGEEESEAKYFSVLVVMLDDIDSDETLTAVICLLSMVVKKMNKSTLLGLQKTTVLETFTKLLIKYMNSDYCALLRNLLSIVYTFLKCKTVWPEKCEELDIILEYTTHHKPKVRRVAHYIIHGLLYNYAPGTSSTHPKAAHVANFCVKKLESNSSDSKEVFYVLNLLHDILGLFPQLHIKKTSETIIKVMTLSNTMVTSSCLKALKGLFQMKSSDTLSTDLNAKIISAMYPYQPNLKETQCLIEWLQLMESAFTNLYKLDEKLCISHLPNFFSNAVKCWLTEREDVMQAIAITLNNLLHVCINPSQEVFQGLLFDDPVNNPMHRMFHHVEGALSYQYHKAWKYVIFVLSGFFEVMGKHCHTVMMKCLQSLAELHDSYKFSHVTDVENALGIAIETMGPRIVLSAIPLQIGEERPDFPRSWLLPLLRDHIKRTELEFFCRHFMVLAKKMRDRALLLKQEERVVESKLFELIYSQIWALLPGFCTEPTDLEKIFRQEGTGGRGLPRTLADLLKFEPTLRLTVLSAIRLLITKNMENEKYTEIMARFSNNYLSVLFNLYSPESKDAVDDKIRLAIYDTIKIYLQITEKEVCESFFTKAMEKLTTPETDIFKQSTLLDIARALLPYVEDKLIQQLYEHSKPLLMHSNHTLQKKAFGVIKEVCSCNSEHCRSFIQTNKDDLRALLCKPITALPPATKALRLSCLQCMLSQLTINEINCIEEMIPEAALSTKENSGKARAAAYNLLVEIGHSLKKLMPDDTKGALRKYVALLLAGLTGTSPPRVMSATILAIGRVLYEFKAEMDSDIIHLLIENICLLLTSRSQEIVVSAMSFLKIIFATVDTLTLAQHVEFLVQNITNLAEENQRHFRFKAKEIFTRLIRKFGYEMISKLVPDKYQKQLTNIRKLEARKQRKKELKNADGDNFEEDKNTNEFDALFEDSDEEMNQDDGLMHGMREPKLKKVKESCLEEHDEDDIVDFMDPSATKRLTSMPTKSTTTETKPMNSFPIAKDGRIIIEDEEEKSKSKKKKDEEIPSFQDLIKKKRKLEDSDEEGEVEPETDTPEIKKGIHRTLQPKAKRSRPGEQFKAKKAGGDMKKGTLEPYAYVPFNKQALNKRKQVKLKGQFKSIVNAAKKGANVGLKRKARGSRKKKHQ